MKTQPLFVLISVVSLSILSGIDLPAVFAAVGPAAPVPAVTGRIATTRESPNALIGVPGRALASTPMSVRPNENPGKGFTYFPFDNAPGCTLNGLLPANDCKLFCACFNTVDVVVKSAGFGNVVDSNPGPIGDADPAPAFNPFNGPLIGVEYAFARSVA